MKRKICLMAAALIPAMPLISFVSCARNDTPIVPSSIKITNVDKQVAKGKIFYI